ncbi:peptidase inhibitor family I36 protein [Nitratireductor kimnyeongensis]|uniref:Peptidase inhibitor family I36 protein n=1 Tax=Nitratireductor kimnyeongensis TaxID=430679 RepID=A0ABW0TAN1_9HYPH|nr:beta/gamma crystallin domain-containing protein [Nitratireductor kimnyeongensis]
MPARIVPILLVLLTLAGLSIPLSSSAHAQRGVAAEATADVKMREGPGMRYRAVLTIPRGARVATLRCTRRYEWCEVGYAARKGWVSARHLRDTRPRYRDRPISDVGALIGLEIFDFVMRELEDRDRDDAFDEIAGSDGDRRPTPRNACFYDRPNFQGRQYCVGIGEDVRVLAPGWRGRFASVRVGKRSSVEICSRPDHNGRCSLLTQDVPHIRQGHVVSSFRVLRRRAGDEPDFESVRRACFFERVEFHGASICFDAGDGNAALPHEWVRRIASVRLEGDVQARICERRNFGGWCETVERSTRRLSEFYNDDVRSIEVY